MSERLFEIDEKSERGRMIEVSDTGEITYLCPCTLGHGYEYQAIHCAKVQERLNDSKLRAEQKCFGCQFYGNQLEPTKFTRYGKERTDVFRGTVFREFCKREELQSEADNYNEVYAERSDAETICADEDYTYFVEKE